MAKRNFQHEKRQKEIAKQKKRDEKMQRKAARKEQGAADDNLDIQPTESPVESD